MFKRLLLVVLGLVFLSACAKPPVTELAETRRIVAYAYASGASSLAAEEYQLAADALRAAEDQVHSGKYQAAEISLGLARNYSNKALALTVQKKQQIELENKRLLAEERLAKELEQAELLRRQREEKARKEAARKSVVNPPAPKQAEKPSLVDRVVVAPAEDLQMIAARPEVYNDDLLWPLIYKANRDQIKDPKEIFAGQVLLVPRDKSPEEIEAARTEARELNLF